MLLSTIGSTTACAACKYQRKKCTKDCLLAPYFPQTNQNQFLNVHRFFGVGNITKMIREVDEPLRDIAMQNLFIHANARARDPVGGLYKVICDYRRKIESAEAELHLVKQQIAFYRSRDQQQQRQDLSFGCYSYGDLLPQEVDYGHEDGYANQNMHQYQRLEQQLYQEMQQQQKHQEMQQQQQYQEIPQQQQQYQEMQLHQQSLFNYKIFSEMPESSSRVKLEKEEQEILQQLQHLEIHQQQQYQEIPQQKQYHEIPLRLQQHQQISLNYGMSTEMPESSSRVKFDKEEEEIPQQQQQYQEIQQQQQHYQEILQQLQHQEMQQHQQISLNYEMFSEMPEPSSRVKAEQKDILR